jgi:magnesium-transporting ATPase (P-type)
MEERKPISHLQAGLLISAILIVYSIALNFLGQAGNQSLATISYLIMIVGIIVFVRMHGSSMNNSLSFGDLFSYGFKTTAVLTIIFIGFLIVFNVIFPDLKEQAFEMARQKLEEDGKLDDDKIDQALEIGRKFFWIGIVGSTLIFFVILGAIGSLIGAAITPKDQINPLDQTIE